MLVRGTSRDVIHSWWIPRLNGKRDMVPGRVQTNRIQADEPGIYAGQCTEFCGLSHANMRMEVIALNPDDFEAWKANQLEAYTSPEPARWRPRGRPSSSRSARVVTRSTASRTPTGTRSCRGPTCTYIRRRPDLTDFTTRNTFAGHVQPADPPMLRPRVGRPPASSAPST